MDSPLLPTIRGSTVRDRDFDQSLGDLTLASDGSPAPIRSQPGRPNPTRGFGGGAGVSLFNRPAPTRNFEETPEVPQRVMSKGTEPGSGTGSGSASGSGSGSGSTARTTSTKPRFSLFAPPAKGQSASQLGKTSTTRPEVMEEEEEAEEEAGGDDAQEKDEGEEEEGEGDQTIIAGQEEQTAESRAARDERLKDSLYELRSINETFEIFLGALESARGHNERLALRVNETSTLLDHYTALLGQTAHTYALLSNTEWKGGDDDIILRNSELAAEQAAELEALRKAQEAERRAEEERERQAEAARAREAAAAAGATRGTARGRGIPGARGGPTRGRGSGIPAPSQRTVSGGKAPPTVRKAPDGLGLAGQYANVKSSGYGPARKAT